MNQEKFLSHFPGYCIQTFSDKAENTVSDKYNKSPLLTFGKPTPEYFKSLTDLNKNGAAICFTPNAFPSGRRKAKDCTGINAWFCDIDSLSIDEQWELVKAAPLMPSLITQTRKSLHLYYLAKDGKIENFTKIQKALIKYFKADPGCKDVCRVLRIPFFFHNKEEPIEVKIVHDRANPYTEEEMIKAFPYDEEDEKPEKKRKKKYPGGLSFWSASSELDNKKMLEMLSGTEIVDYEVYTFRDRSNGGYYIDVNGKPADAWIDENGMIGSGKGGGPTFIQWMGYYGLEKGIIAEWIKTNCADLLPEEVLNRNIKKDGEESATQAQELFNMFENQDPPPTMFHDEIDEAYAQVDIDGKKRIFKVETRAFKKFLGKFYWDTTGKAIDTQSLEKTVNIISGIAEYDGPQYKLYNRVGVYNNDYWYDLGDSRAVCCKSGSWEIIDDVPIIFRTSQHQNPQVLPSRDGSDISLLLKHIAIKSDEQQILFLVWVVSCFIPKIPHPLMIFYGEKGSAKSTTMSFLRLIIDPSKTELLSMPKQDQLERQLFYNYAAFYDNLTRIYQSTSDIFCRAITGSGNTERKFYTQDEDIIRNIRCVVGLNGINNVARSPDLIDRSIIIEFKRISKEERKTGEAVKEAFLKDLPSILGGIFDVLAKTREIRKTLTIDAFPRMADFALHASVIAEALGYGTDAFIKAYENNISKQNEEILEDDPVANTICIFMGSRDKWEGTPKELFCELSKIAEEAKINPHDMPKNPSSLGKRIRIVLSNLRDAEIYISMKKDTDEKRGRFYRITKHDDSPASLPLNLGNNGDACDSKNQDNPTP